MSGTGLQSVITLPAKYIMSLVGTLLSLSGFIALVTSNSVKVWVRSHPYPIYIALIVAVTIIAGSLNYAYNLRKRVVQPTSHDALLYASALSTLPSGGTVIDWLKRADMTHAKVTDFPADVLASLEKTTELARTRPVGFDNRRLAAAFASLTTAITGFCTAVENWTLAAHLYGGSADETPAMPAVITSHLDLVEAYDRFVRTAHSGGINTDS